VVVPGRGGGRADGVLVVLAGRTLPCGVAASSREPVGVVRPDEVPVAAARRGVDNDEPTRKAGDDVVRDIPDGSDLDADDDVGAA